MVPSRDIINIEGPSLIHQALAPLTLSSFVTTRPSSSEPGWLSLLRPLQSFLFVHQMTTAVPLVATMSIDPLAPMVS